MLIERKDSLGHCGVCVRRLGLGLLKALACHVQSNWRHIYLAFSATTDSVAHDICMRWSNISRPPGEMASRLTTNQEIAGSTPAVVIVSFFFPFFPFLSLSGSRVATRESTRMRAWPFFHWHLALQYSTRFRGISLFLCFPPLKHAPDSNPSFP